MGSYSRKRYATESASFPKSASSAPGSYSYATFADLPASGSTPGNTAFVVATNKLYIWSGVGWYLIATVTNASPTAISGVNGSYSLAIDGTATTITAVSTDPEGFSLTWSYAVSSGSLGSTATVAQADNVFTITPSTNTANAGTFSLTFSVTDGLNGVVSSVSAFTLSFSITNSRYTALSVKATNNPTYILSDTHSPAGQHIPLGFVAMPSNQIFTIEGWFRIDSTSAAEIWFFDQHTASAGSGRSMLGVRAGNIAAYGTGGWSNGSSAFSDTTTYKHLAWVQNGSDTLNFYVNGVASGTHTAFGQTLQQNTMFGENTAYGSGGFSCKGFRVTNTAVYTSGFTPPNIIGGLTDISGTQVLWDGSVGTATDASSNNRSLTNSGMTFTATTGSNQTFDDASVSNHTITVANDVTASTFSPHRHGGYSAYFDGTGDYLNLNSDAEFAFGTNDFTVEFWVYLTSQNGSLTMFFDFRGSSGNGRYPALFLNGDNTLTYWYDSGTRITSNAIDLKAWNHIALTRSGTDVKLFINGQQEGSTFTDSSTQLIGTNAPIFGNDTSASFGVIGYMSDIRILNGTAAYTSNFTPPTQPLTAITNTKFLLGRLPYFKDQSTSNHAITVGGDASLRPFSSFDNAPYSEASHGASAYFEGTTGNRLTIPHHADFDFSGDYVLEFWCNLEQSANNQLMFDKSIGANNNFQIYTLSSNNKIGAFIDDSSSNTIVSYSNVGPVLVGTGWHHFSLVRDNSAGTYVSYIDGVVVNTTTSAYNCTSTKEINIGAQHANHANVTKGHISDFKFLTAIPSDRNAAFTPPTAPLTTSPTYSALAIGVANSGASSYTLSGDVTGSNATVNMAVGQTVNFTVNASGHPFYIRVSDGGANVSTPVATGQGATSGVVSWTPNTAGTYYYQCSVHSGMIGTINVTNGVKFLLNPETSISDLSQRNALITVGGVATSTTQVKFSGTKSIYIGAQGDYINSIHDSTISIFPNGDSQDWTLEYWYYPTSIAGFNYIFTIGDDFQMTAVNGGLGIWTKNGGSTLFQQNQIHVVTENTWSHVAIVRNGNNYNVYVDGVSRFNTTNSNEVQTGTNNLHIGDKTPYNNGVLNFYIQDFRITKGLARYTANFTPPTELQG